MFDSTLTREKALANIGEPKISKSFQVSKEIIDLCRQTSEARNHCFSSENNHRQSFGQFQALLTTFRKKFVLSDAVLFLYHNMNVYTEGGPAQRHYATPVRDVTLSLLDETVSNAMAQSDDVHVAIDITQKGLLIDVNQGESGFDSEFLQDLERKSADVRDTILKGGSLKNLIQLFRGSIRKTIGYVPPGLDEMNGLPYRGNGIGNILIDNFFKVNFLPHATDNKTIAVHTATQLQDALRFTAGDRSVVNRLYGTSTAKKVEPLTKTPDRNTRAVDDVFGDVEDLFT